MLATKPHLSPKVALQKGILLRDGRLRGDRAEDEGRGEAAGVPADGDPADLDPGGIEAWDRLFIRLSQHPATRIDREPAHRVRYVRRDLHGHEGWDEQGPCRTRSRGRGLATSGYGRVVFLEGM